ncbi:MAG TPA: hypothetical protein ENJ02_04455 [Chloroflexi bacterium]|nr:hypothetical protein [Chloroflexota bacterium]
MTTSLTAYYAPVFVPLQGGCYFAAGQVPQWQQRFRLLVNLAVAVANDPQAPADLRDYCRRTLLEPVGEQTGVIHIEREAEG